MSRIRLKKYLYGGIQFVSIVDENDCPLDVYAAAYINSVLSRKAFNTTVRYSNELLFALCYFTNRSIDLTARVANGRLISYPEYLSFFDFCHHQKSAPLEPHVIPFLGVEDKHLRNAKCLILSFRVTLESDISNGWNHVKAFRCSPY